MYKRQDKQLVGHLRIGMIGHMPPEENSRISAAIARFRRRDEAVRMTLLVRAPGELEERLLNGQLDLAIAYFWHRAPTLHFTPLFLSLIHISYRGYNTVGLALIS